MSALEHPLLQDMAIHLFDAARAISGADPVSVYCESFRPPWTWYPGACSAMAIFEMTGGLRYTFTGSWSAHGLPTSWTGSWRAAGERGTAPWDGEDALMVGPAPASARPAEPDRTRPGAPPLPGLAEGLADSSPACARAFAAGRVPRQPPQPGHGDAALESAARGVPVAREPGSDDSAAAAA